MSDTQRPPMRKCGVGWKPKAGARTLGTFVVTIGTLKQKCYLVADDRKQSDSQPDFLLLANADPEPDDYAPRTAAGTGRSQPCRV